MKKLKAVFAIFGAFIFSCCGFDPTYAAQPTCENIRGAWINQIGSKMMIESVNPSGGEVKGSFHTATGLEGQYPLMGWVNYKNPEKTGHNVHTIAFIVRWGEKGSVNSWTGTCETLDGVPTLKTLWHLAEPNAPFNWGHILTGSDTFVPQR